MCAYASMSDQRSDTCAAYGVTGGRSSCGVPLASLVSVMAPSFQPGRSDAFVHIPSVDRRVFHSPGMPVGRVGGAT